MKSFIVFALFVAVASSAAVYSGAEKDAVTTDYQFNNIGVDGYNFKSATSNGLIREEQAFLKNVGTEQEALEVTGHYSYPAPDGQIYQLRFVANEFGFQPVADYLPKAPVV